MYGYSIRLSLLGPQHVRCYPVVSAFATYFPRLRQIQLFVWWDYCVPCRILLHIPRRNYQPTRRKPGRSGRISWYSAGWCSGCMHGWEVGLFWDEMRWDLQGSPQQTNTRKTERQAEANVIGMEWNKVAGYVHMCKANKKTTAKQS